MSETMELPPTPPLDAPLVDEPPKRGHGGKPTTRAGRAAQAAANRAAKADVKPKPAPKLSGKNAVADGVNGLHQLAGGLVLPLCSMPGTGQALVEAGPQAAEAWTALSKRYPAIEKMFTTSGDAALFMALITVYGKVAAVAMQEAQTPKDQRTGEADGGMIGGLLAMLVPQQAPAPVAEQQAA